MSVLLKSARNDYFTLICLFKSCKNLRNLCSYDMYAEQSMRYSICKDNERSNFVSYSFRSHALIIINVRLVFHFALSDVDS